MLVDSPSCVHPNAIPNYPYQQQPPPPPNANAPYPAPMPGHGPGPGPGGPVLGFNPNFSSPTPSHYPNIANVPNTPVPAYGYPTNAPKWIPSSNGSVPPNAVTAGTDVSGELIYVARAAHEGALIPGKLVPSHRVAYVAWGGRENPKDGYEVRASSPSPYSTTNGCKATTRSGSSTF